MYSQPQWRATGSSSSSPALKRTSTPQRPGRQRLLLLREGRARRRLRADRTCRHPLQRRPAVPGAHPDLRLRGQRRDHPMSRGRRRRRARLCPRRPRPWHARPALLVLAGRPALHDPAPRRRRHRVPQRARRLRPLRYLARHCPVPPGGPGPLRGLRRRSDDRGAHRLPPLPLHRPRRGVVRRRVRLPLAVSTRLTCRRRATDGAVLAPQAGRAGYIARNHGNAPLARVLPLPGDRRGVWRRRGRRRARWLTL